MQFSITNLSKRFGERTVLDQISLNLEEGEILFVLGKSGTGKSVLLKNIVGLLKPDFGEIHIDKENVTQLSEHQYYKVRQKCGMVFQQPALFDSLTIFENIAFGLRRHFQVLTEEQIVLKVRRYLELVGLNDADIESKYPQEISYGMQKRVSLARTLAIEPSILLFDEPTTGLDPVTTKSINGMIKNLSNKLRVSSIVVSHDIECAFAIADRIAFLDEGKIVAMGRPAELKSSTIQLVRDFLLEMPMYFERDANK